MSNPGRTASIRQSFMVAALFIGATAGLRLLSPEFIDAVLAQRLIGIMMGGIVVFYANAVPKLLTPLARLRSNPAKEQAMRRFTGLCLVLGGAGFALAWMFAPIAQANLAAGILLGSALLVVALRYAVLFADDSAAE